MPAEASVRALTPTDTPVCESILRALPEWFGIEASTAQYVRDLRSLPTAVAIAEGEVVGLLALRHHNPQASEIHVLAVRRDCHRSGIGRMLVRHAESELARSGVRLLQVKTLGPSHPDQSYRGTRAFYAAMGFLPLEETAAHWGEENPCLIMVKPLPVARRSQRPNSV